MPFPGPDFMAWAKTLNHDIKYDLFSSGMHGLTTEAELGITNDSIKVWGNNEYGYQPLKELLAEKYSVHPDQVMTSQGSSGANYLIAATIFEKPGGTAIVESPCYQPLSGAIQGTGAIITRLHRRFEDKYRIDIDQIKDIWTSNTRLLVLTRLHNPSGVDIPIDTLKKLNDFAAEHNAWVLVDEVYLDFMENAIPAVSIGNRMITTSSTTKVYGLGDLRFGWAVGDRNLIQRAMQINDYISVKNPFISEYLGYHILSSKPVMDLLHKRIQERVTSNRAIFTQWIHSMPGIEWVPPDGGIITFPKIGDGTAGDRLAQILLEKYQTAVTPGRFFDNPSHIRIGFGAEPVMLMEGLQRTKAAYSELIN
jgi:aspartate/methionine/tyrosine aminotransferase